MYQTIWGKMLGTSGLRERFKSNIADKGRRIVVPEAAVIIDSATINTLFLTKELSYGRDGLFG
jgi:hypothetical protein